MLMMLVVSLRGVNHRFWSLLGCSGRNINIFLANKVSFRVYREEIIKNTVMFILKQYLWYLRFKCSLCHALIELLWVYSNFLLSIPDFFRCSSFHLHSPLPPPPTGYQLLLMQEQKRFGVTLLFATLGNYYLKKKKHCWEILAFCRYSQ